MIVRKAKVKEARVLGRLWLDFMREHDAMVVKREKALAPHLAKRQDARKTFEAYVVKQIRSSRALVLVAEDEGRLVGYSLNLVKKNIPVFKSRELGYLADLYVTKPYRGSGVSTLFKNRAIAWFKEKGLKYASIMVSPQNVHAHPIYQGWGFTDYHVELRKKI